MRRVRGEGPGSVRSEAGGVGGLTRAQAANQRIRDLRRRRRERGLCEDCGETATPGRRKCDRHRAADSAKTARWQARRHARGLCIYCGKRPQCENGRTCVPCLFGALERQDARARFLRAGGRRIRATF